MKVHKDLYDRWKKEEQTPFSGWDFSHIRERMKEDEPHWDYGEEARRLVRDATSVLDLGTGGGEILASLGPFPRNTTATEGWSPNVPVARKRLEPLGIKVVAVDDSEKLPFSDREFDLVLNRQSGYDRKEVFRILQNNGVFFTQQVSGDNLQDLVEEFDAKTRFKGWNAGIEKKRLEEVGFKIERYEEWKGNAEFKDVGAIVYFLKAIPWIVKDFSVDKYLSTLENLQRELDAGKRLIFTETRFLIKAHR
jgi:SAM-dependent methyltransferase